MYVSYIQKAVNRLAISQSCPIKYINFPGASTQTPQGRLPPASQERGISPNLATLGASLYAPRGGECTHSHSIISLHYMFSSLFYSIIRMRYPSHLLADSLLNMLIFNTNFFQNIVLQYSQ